MKTIAIMILLVGGCPVSQRHEMATSKKTEAEKDAEFLRSHPIARIDDKVNYRTGKGIPVREDEHGVLYDGFGGRTPYQRIGNPNAERITIKEGPDC